MILALAEAERNIRIVAEGDRVVKISDNFTTAPAKISDNYPNIPLSFWSMAPFDSDFFRKF